MNQVEQTPVQEDLMVHRGGPLGGVEFVDLPGLIQTKAREVSDALLAQRMDPGGTTTGPAVAVWPALDQPQSDQSSQTLPGCLQADLLQYSDLLGREKLIGSQMAQKVKLLPGQRLAHGL